MIATTLVALFVISSIAVVAGYYNTLMGFDLLPIQLVFREVAVLKAATLHTVLAPINITVAFLTSRGSYRLYKEEIMALALTTPFIVIFAVLPGATKIDGALQLNLMPMAILLAAAQFGACHALRDRAWKYGAGMSAHNKALEFAHALLGLRRTHLRARLLQPLAIRFER